MKRGVTLSSLALLFSLGCSTPTMHEHKTVPGTRQVQESSQAGENPSEAYALVVVGSSRGERGDVDQIDRNCFFLSGVRGYTSIREMGIPAEHMRFLYDDGQPDFSEPLEHDDIACLRREQFGRYDNRATQANIEGQIAELGRLVDDNDTFILYLSSHGAPDLVEIPHDVLTTAELDSALTAVHPERGLFVLDACSSGGFIRNMRTTGYAMISSTQATTFGWLDRHYATGAGVFENFTDSMSDTDMDGHVTVREAFERTRTESEAHWAHIQNYLRTRYQGVLLGGSSMTPTIHIPEGASEDWIFYAFP